MTSPASNPVARKGLPLRMSIILLTVAVALVTAGVVAVASYLTGSQGLEADALKQLEAKRTALQRTLVTHFEGLRAGMVHLSENAVVREAADAFARARGRFVAEIEAGGVPTSDSVRTFVESEMRQKYLEDTLLRRLKGANLSVAVEKVLEPSLEARLLQMAYFLRNTAAEDRKDERAGSADLRTDIETAFSTDLELRGAPAEMRQNFGAAFANTSYAKATDRFHDALRALMVRARAADLYLVDERGFVVFSVKKGFDFANDLSTDANKETATLLAEAHRNAFDATAASPVRFTDVGAYLKAYGSPNFFVSAPVFSGDSQNQTKLGTVILRYPAEQLTRVLSFAGADGNEAYEAAGLGLNGEAYLVGRDSRLRSDVRNVAGFAQARVYTPADGGAARKTSVGTPVSTTAVARVFEAGRGATDRTSAARYPGLRGAEREVLGAFAPTVELPTPFADMALVVEQPVSEALAGQGSQLTNAGIVGGGVAVVMALLGFLVASGVSKPYEKLAEAAKRASVGNYTQKADEVGGGEAELIARTFNNMLDGLLRSQQKEQAETVALQEGIRNLLMVISDATDGDFTVRAPITEGALGNLSDAFNLMLETTSDLIRQTKEAALRVASSSIEIQASAEQLSQGSTRQTEEIVNTTAAVQEMAANTESVSTNAKSASEAAGRAKAESEAGAKAVTRVIEGMERIRANVQAASKKIKRLGERSMEISVIVNTISQISAQTDMLALNAAIEAARAGDQGRGFTVVAEEVRKLAERAANATSDIEKLITGIQAETNESVTSMERQTAEVEAESAVVADAGQSLRRIREAAVQSAELINEINLAAQQQVRGAKGVVQAIEIVLQIAQQAQAATSQTKRATESLTALADNLTSQINKFNVS